MSLGITLEFVRHHDKNFEAGVEEAVRRGYAYVEPMVHLGRELLSEAGYFHSVSMFDDPYRVRRACEKAGVRLSGLSSRTPLCKPEIGTEYLKMAIRFAAECGAPVVNDNEGPKATWTTGAEDQVLVTGTPVGCACGDRVIDWKRVIDLCRLAPRDIVLSVECGTIEQAERSSRHLRPLR